MLSLPEADKARPYKHQRICGTENERSTEMRIGCLKIAVPGAEPGENGFRVSTHVTEVGGTHRSLQSHSLHGGMHSKTCGVRIGFGEPSKRLGRRRGQSG